MTSLEQIMLLWEEDCLIDSNQLGNASTDTPRLHAKYLRLLMQSKTEYHSLEQEYNVMRQIRIRYYRGELSKEELKAFNWDQYQYNKPLKTEYDDLLKGDNELMKLISKISDIDILISALESILSQLKQRDFQISNHIKWKQFLAGN